MSAQQVGEFWGRDPTLMNKGMNKWGPTYNNWDANVTSVCFCDNGKLGGTIARHICNHHLNHLIFDFFYLEYSGFFGADCAQSK